MLEIIKLKLEDSKKSTIIHLALFAILLVATKFIIYSDGNGGNGENVNEVINYIWFFYLMIIYFCAGILGGGFTSLYGYYKRTFYNKQNVTLANICGLEHNLKLAGIPARKFFITNLLYSVFNYLVFSVVFLTFCEFCTDATLDYSNYIYIGTMIIVIIVLNLTQPIHYYFDFGISLILYDDIRNKSIKHTLKSRMKLRYQYHVDHYGNPFAEFYEKTTYLRGPLRFISEIIIVIFFYFFLLINNETLTILAILFMMASCAYYLILYCVYERSQHELR